MRWLLLALCVGCAKPRVVASSTLQAAAARQAFEEADPIDFPLGEVIGFADLHTHPFAEDGFGQRVVLGGAPGGGSNWHGMRPGLSRTLKAVAPSMVDDPTAAALLRHNSEDSEPSFHDWTHDQYTTVQLRQAHEEGLRFMGALAVNQQLSCAISQSYTGSDRSTCSDLINIRRQVERTWEFDRDHDWFHVTLSPVAANHAMAAGRTAVVLGYEASDYLDHRRRGGLIPRRNLLGDGWVRLVREAGLSDEDNCKSARDYLDGLRERTRTQTANRRQKDGARKADFPAAVLWQADVLTDVLHKQGMRTFIPVHHWNSAVGGNALQQISLLQPGYQMVANQGRLQRLSALRLGSGFSEFILRHNNLSSWPTVVELGEDPDMDGVRYMRNAQGLTPLGKQVFKRAYEKGFLIDLSHLGDNSVRDALDPKVLPRHAPVMLSHYTPRATTLRHRDEREYQASQSLLLAIAARGGLVGLRTAGERVRGMGGPVPNLCHGSLFSFAQMYEYSVQLGLNPAYGTDMNGGASQTWPASGAEYGCGAHASDQERMIGRALARTWAKRPGARPSGGVWSLGMEHVGLLGDLTRSLDAVGQPMVGIWTTGNASVDAWYRSTHDAPPPPAMPWNPDQVAGRHDQDGDCIPDVMESQKHRSVPSPDRLRDMLIEVQCRNGDTECLHKLPVCATGPAQELTPESTRTSQNVLERLR